MHSLSLSQKVCATQEFTFSLFCMSKPHIHLGYHSLLFCLRLWFWIKQAYKQGISNKKTIQQTQSRWNHWNLPLKCFYLELSTGYLRLCQRHYIHRETWVTWLEYDLLVVAMGYGVVVGCARCRIALTGSFWHSRAASWGQGGIYSPVFFFTPGTSLRKPGTTLWNI